MNSDNLRPVGWLVRRGGTCTCSTCTERGSAAGLGAVEVEALSTTPAERRSLVKGRRHGDGKVKIGLAVFARIGKGEPQDLTVSSKYVRQISDIWVKVLKRMPNSCDVVDRSQRLSRKKRFPTGWVIPPYTGKKSERWKVLGFL